MDNWYSESKNQGWKPGTPMVYLVGLPDGTFGYVDEGTLEDLTREAEECGKEINIKDRLPESLAPDSTKRRSPAMKSDHLDRFDRYMH